MISVPQNYKYGNITVGFYPVSKQLIVSIKTPHLVIRSVRPYDTNDFCTLFADKKTYEEIIKKVKKWSARWDAGHYCSVLAVRLNGPSNKFIGYLGLKDKNNGKVKLFGHGYTDYWERYGFEATAAITQAYVKGINEILQPEEPLFSIEAATEVNSKNSNEILRKLGRQFVKEEMFYYRIASN